MLSTLRRCVSAGMILCTAVVGLADARELTIQQADALARAAFEHRIAHIGNRVGYSLDPQTYRMKRDPRFASFEVIGVWHKDQGSAILAHYDVDRLTADVWDTYLDCVRVNDFQLRRAQDAYRKQYHLVDPRKVPFARPYAC